MSFRALTVKASARPMMALAARQAPIGLRYMSTPAPQEPKAKANSIIVLLLLLPFMRSLMNYT
mgnify:CR=1 FL=1